MTPLPVAHEGRSFGPLCPQTPVALWHLLLASGAARAPSAAAMGTPDKPTQVAPRHTGTVSLTFRLGRYLSRARLRLMELPDPILPLPDAPLELPEGSTDEERLKAAFIAAYDHVNLHAMAWPARDADGNLVPPPGEHVLHELAHAYDLVDEERLLASPRLGDVAVVQELPKCDFCRDDARYDAVVEINGTKGGAYLCGVHYLERGSGSLGASGATYLMLESEVPGWVQDACNRLLAAQGREPIF